MNWHRLFGLLLTDFFAGSPFVVELEKDLSIKKQLLDVVILRKHQPLTASVARSLILSGRALPELTPADEAEVAEAIQSVRRRRRRA